MNCCSECFSSATVKDKINSNRSIGNCDFCNSKDIYVYNPKDLNLIFQNILDLYILDRDNGKPIEEQIEADFPNQIFSPKVKGARKALLQEIISDDFELFEEIFANDVLNVTKHSDSLEVSKPFLVTWEKFAEEIQTINRFHIKNLIDLNKLETLLSYYEKSIHIGKKYFRARISALTGFPAHEMGNPPINLAKPGRANPEGISYLYLSDEEITTLYETRASLYDYVTVGEFRLKKDIKVVDLRGNSFDPVKLSSDTEGSLKEFLAYQPFTSELEKQLSKPKRRNDKELDYLPTQYLSEFIKSIGYEGVLFQSSLYEQGYNLAIFDPDLFECINVKVCEVKKIDISHEPIP